MISSLRSPFLWSVVVLTLLYLSVSEATTELWSFRPKFGSSSLERQKTWPRRDSINNFLSDREYLESLINTTDILTKSH
jgi:hypothetical protein